MRNNRGRSDSRRYEDWLKCAGNDLIAALTLLETEGTRLLSAFHTHQVIEKSLKGFFLYHKNAAPDGHNLIYLCRQAAMIDNNFYKWFDLCIDMSNYYIQTRYPADFPLVLTYDSVDSLINSAREIYLYICNKLNGNLNENKNED